MNIQSTFKKAIAVSAIALTTAVTSNTASADTILHAFNWEYDEVAEKAQEIADLGYKKVLVSPAYKSTGDQWWARYQPQDIRVIDNPLGDTNDFKAMVTALKSKGVETYADIVFNHMANEASQRSDLNYPGAAVLAEYAAAPTLSENIKLFGDITDNFLAAHDFQAPGCITDYTNVHQVQTLRLCGGNGDRGYPISMPIIGLLNNKNFISTN
ncbi:alpha-amylase family glycosyl hydrolase [Psychrobium sp. nBUS_13]|uniref:alpha-amylase family glycosyl hydrolase n=1 Tax=Psychrobium sp. nBUS_13 TaxID=3395319 RepID=UPI003EBE37F3